MSQAVRPWEGRLLRVYRLSPAEQRDYPTAEHLAYFEQLRDYERRLIEARDAKLAELSSAGSPIAPKAPKASPEDLERGDDDDEISGDEEGEICGLDGQACCQTTRRGPCDTGLMCVKQKCQLPPRPCGGFEQICCAEGDPCRVQRGRSTSMFSCMPSDMGEQQCLIPPPKPERLKTPIGLLEVVSVKNEVIKALVRRDILKDRSASDSINAISIGDRATWHLQ